MDVNYLALPGITAICGIIIQVVKNSTGESANKWLPLISIALGAVLGVTAAAILPNHPVQDIFNAMLTGVVSGAAATGIHQVKKQNAK